VGDHVRGLSRVEIFQHAQKTSVKMWFLFENISTRYVTLHEERHEYSESVAKVKVIRKSQLVTKRISGIRRAKMDSKDRGK
jgi:hypothetical protein